jgi:hypothetical protein
MFGLGPTFVFILQHRLPMELLPGAVVIRCEDIAHEEAARFGTPSRRPASLTDWDCSQQADPL